jgi:hypothetical protein
MTQNLDDFIYVVILPIFWQALAQTTDHLWRALFILYTPDTYTQLWIKRSFNKVFWHWISLFFPSKTFFKLTLCFDGFFTMNSMFYGTPCMLAAKLLGLYIKPVVITKDYLVAMAMHIKLFEGRVLYAHAVDLWPSRNLHCSSHSLYIGGQGRNLHTDAWTI